MTSKQDFTDEEWTRIRRAPLVAGVAISLADPARLRRLDLPVPHT